MSAQSRSSPKGGDGIEIPRWMALKMDVVEKLCRRLVDGGAPSIHFYLLDQSGLALELCRRLGAA